MLIFYLCLRYSIYFNSIHVERDSFSNKIIWVRSRAKVHLFNVHQYAQGTWELFYWTIYNINYVVFSLTKIERRQFFITLITEIDINNKMIIIITTQFPINSLLLFFIYSFIYFFFVLFYKYNFYLLGFFTCLNNIVYIIIIVFNNTTIM